MAVPATNTLATIEQKVRRLTRSPSEAQLTTDQLDQYINTFIAYDVPEHLRLFNLRTTFTFYTEPFVDVYESSTDPTSPLYQFVQQYLTVHPPIYIAGFQSFYTQSRQEFFNIYPKINSISSIPGIGNGINTQFSGVVNTSQTVVPPNSTQLTCILRNEVLFSSVDTAGNGLAMIDYPISPLIGNLYVPGGAPTSTTIQDPINYINYVTGAFTVTFPTAPAVGVLINSQVVFQAPTRPVAMCFYDGKFILRPVPDQPYRVQMEVYQRPTQLLSSSQSPQLEEWWQYFAYGAAKKVFEDRMDMDSVQLIMPEFKKQENLIQRRTIVQYTNDRTATIYTDQTALGMGYNGWGWGGGLF
jgi:hypothetical protein